MGLVNLDVAPYGLLLFLNYITRCCDLKWDFIWRWNIIWFLIRLIRIFIIITFLLFLLVYPLYFIYYFPKSNLCFFVYFLWYPSYYILLTQYSIRLAPVNRKFIVGLSFHVYLFQLLRRLYILNNICYFLFRLRSIKC
jgi:hypothetical protein